ncbi:MAG: hypothetical protein Q9P90_00380 [candidate division KSB1 bacterium]|nr:hypothetical protein [candidate division KSB1 bacterium]
MYSIDRYEKLLRLGLRQGYVFKPFAESTIPKHEKVIFLRHDIDYSPEIAVEFAQVNHACGIQGTFFFLMRSSIYNLFSDFAQSCIRKINLLNQRVGLHVYLPDLKIKTSNELIRFVQGEFELFKKVVPFADPVFSWHNPGQIPGLIQNNADITIPGLINAYSRYFFEQVKYVSDSDLRYSVDELEAILYGGYTRLQLLFHPFEWVCGDTDMIGVIARTWKWIIRGCETGVLQNKVYRKHFPEGIPEAIIHQFVDAVKNAKSS